MARRVKLHRISTIALIFLFANFFAIGEWISFCNWQTTDNLQLLMGIKSGSMSDKKWVSAWAGFHFISWSLSGIAFWYLTSIYFAFTCSLQSVMTLDDTQRSIEAKIIFLTQGSHNYQVFKYCGFFIIIAVVGMDSFFSWCYFNGLITSNYPIGNKESTYRFLT